MKDTQKKNDELIVQAISYLNAGFSVFPVYIRHNDESKIKTPAISQWTPYQSRQMSAAQIEGFLKGYDNKGIALACGYYDTYVIDWDAYTDKQKDIVDKITNAIFEDMPEVADKIYIETTLRGGVHWIIRHEGPAIKPNRALVKILNDDGKYKKLVESKGFGGYVVIAPTEGYNGIHMELTDILPLTKEEYTRLMKIICSFTEEATPQEKERMNPTPTDVNNYIDCPFAAYKDAESKNMLSFLTSRGWKLLREPKRGLYHLSKPNRTRDKVHGVLSMLGDYSGWFMNFSTSSDIPEGNYNAADLMMQYEFNNNASNFSRWAVQNGYGKHRPKTESTFKEPEPFDGDEEVEDKEDLLFMNTPTLSDDCVLQLPQLIQELVEGLEGRQRDMAIIHAIGILSGCLFNVRVKWGKKWEPCNLFTYVIAPAAFGKGVCDDIAQIADGIDNYLTSETAAAMITYTSEKTQWEHQNKGKTFEGEAPKQRELVLTGDSTSAGIIERLKSNDIILIADTEGDTMKKALKGKHGDFLDTLRKCYHGELIGVNRKGEGNFKARKKYIAMAMASTKKQAMSIVTNAEDGTISRISFFAFNAHSEYMHPNLFDGLSLSQERVDVIKDKVLNYYFLPECKVVASHEQNLKAQEFGVNMLNQCNIIGEEAAQIAKRSGLQFYRIAALLANIKRCEENNRSLSLNIDDATWNASKEIINMIYHCNLRMLLQVADNEEKIKATPSARSNAFKLLDALPKTFTYKDAIDTGKALDIPMSSAKRYLSSFLKGTSKMKQQIRKKDKGYEKIQ